jgi:hypothetical protein
MAVYTYSSKQKVAEYKDYYQIPPKYKLSPYYRIVSKWSIGEGRKYCIYDDRK